MLFGSYKLFMNSQLYGNGTKRWRFRKETINKWLDKGVENEETDNENGENNS